MMKKKQMIIISTFMLVSSVLYCATENINTDIRQKLELRTDGSHRLHFHPRFFLNNIKLSRQNEKEFCRIMGDELTQLYNSYIDFKASVWSATSQLKKRELAEKFVQYFNEMVLKSEAKYILALNYYKKLIELEEKKKAEEINKKRLAMFHFQNNNSLIIAAHVDFIISFVGGLRASYLFKTNSIFKIGLSLDINFRYVFASPGMEKHEYAVSSYIDINPMLFMRIDWLYIGIGSYFGFRVSEHDTYNTGYSGYVPGAWHEFFDVGLIYCIGWIGNISKDFIFFGGLKGLIGLKKVHYKDYTGHKSFGIGFELGIGYGY